MLPDIEKDGTISSVLQQGQEVIVQIVKEPISTKGPRLTCELSFAGRYLVLIPFNDKVSVSQKSNPVRKEHASNNCCRASSLRTSESSYVPWPKESAWQNWMRN